MRYIRLNNDVKIKWEILRNTDPEVFTNKDITVKLFSKCGCEQPISYTIVDNKIFIDYFGKDQRETGSYRLCLIENDGKKNMATLDYVDCFTLSKTLKNQTSTGSDSSSSLKTEVIELSSKINTTGVEYVGGDGIDVVGSVISVDETVARTDKLTELEAKVDTKADKTELPDVSIYNPTDNFKTINGQSIIGTGDVVIEVPNNLSQLNNDMDYITRSETVDINTYNQHIENQSVENTNFNNNITELQNNKADKTELPDVSIYNPTDNFKTVNGQSIIGTGDVVIQSSSGDVTSAGDNNFYGYNTFYNNLNTFGGITITDPRYSERKTSIFDILTQDYSYTASIRHTISTDNVYESGKKIVWSEQDNRYIIVSDTNYNIRNIGLYNTLNYVSGITNNYEAFWWSGENTAEGQKIFTKIEYNTSPSNAYVYEIFINLPADFTENVYLDCSCNNNLQNYLEGNGFIKEAPLDGNQYARQNGSWALVQGGSGDITANGDNTFNGSNTFNNLVYIYNSLYYKDPRDSNYTSEIFNVLTQEHTSQLSTYNNMDAVYESGKKLVWSEEQNKAIIVEDANYNIKYCSSSVYSTINYVYDVTNGYEAFWWNGQYAENGVDKIIKKVDINTSPSNEYVHEFYVNVSVDYTEDVNVYYYVEAQFQSYLESSSFIKDAPFDGNQYVRQNGSWTTVQGGSGAVTSVNGQTGDVTIDIPTNVSQLNNDAGYLTEHQDLSNYATKTELTEYNKTNNFKTINNQSIIGTGNIEIQGGSGDITANGDNTFNGTNIFNNPVYIYNYLYCKDPRDSNYTSDIFNVLTESHPSQLQTYNNIDSVYESGKKLVWSEEQNKAIIVEDANYNIKYCNSVYNTINYVYDVTNGYEAFWWNGQYTENGVDKILKKVEINTSPFNEFVHEFYVNVPVDYTEAVNVYYYYDAQFQSYLEGSGFIKDAPFDGNQYARQNGSWALVQGGSSAVTSVNGATGDVTIEVPTNVSQLNNDAGYLTAHQDLSNYATKTELTEYNKTNNFKTINNQSIIGTGNIEIQVSSAVTSVNGHTGDVTIEVPTNVSQLNNDAGYLTTHQDLSNYATTEFVNTSTNNGHIVWTGTQAEYDALSDKTVYLIYLIKKV